VAAEVAPNTANALTAAGMAVSMAAKPLELLRSSCGQQLDDLAPLLTPLSLTALDLLTLGDLLDLSGKSEDPHLIMVLAWLFTALNEGSVCLKLTAAHLPRAYTPELTAEAAKHLEAFQRKAAAGVYTGLMAAAPSDAPLIRVSPEAETEMPALLYFQRYYRHEARLKARLECFLDMGATPLCPPHRLDAMVTDLWRSKRVIRLGASRRPITADPWQQAALALALRQPLAVISGGPGTGKTSLMVNMLRLLVACNVDVGKIRLTAPTGRAAQRMREALDRYLPGIDQPTSAEKQLVAVEAVTLHRLLRYQRRQRSFHYHADHPLPAQAVIVDEVSMIDVEMLDRLLQAIDPRHTRLILLGDKDQLPSVQAGAVFAALIPPMTSKNPTSAEGAEAQSGHRFNEHLVILRNSYRSGRRLLKLAEAVNSGRMPEVAHTSMASALSLPPDSFAAISASANQENLPAAAVEFLAQWMAHHYAAVHADGRPDYLSLATELSGHRAADLMGDTQHPPLGDLFAKLDQARILCIARHGPLGCVALNRLGINYLVNHHGLATDPNTGLFSGAPLLITRNDYGRQLFNGDVGIALKDDAGNLRVYIQRGQGFISAPLATIKDWEPAFATTVHKSQGSEYTDVLLVFPGDPHHRLLFREILYTGITRARSRLLLVASPEDLQVTLARRIERSSGLIWST
jgi:exodeoxyribonuclease V alpha subunit